jgi:hypothetical protein
MNEITVLVLLASAIFSAGFLAGYVVRASISSPLLAVRGLAEQTIGAIEQEIRRPAHIWYGGSRGLQSPRGPGEAVQMAAQAQGRSRLKLPAALRLIGAVAYSDVPPSFRCSARFASLS